MKTLLLLAIGCTILFHAFSQATGDYRSKATGDWNAASSWERFDGTSWVAAVVAPSSTDGVITIQNGHTITNTTAVTVDQLDVEGLLVQNSTMNIRKNMFEYNDHDSADELDEDHNDSDEERSYSPSLRR